MSKATIQGFRPVQVDVKAAASAAPDISVIIPTYREAANVRELAQSIDAVRTKHNLNLDVWLMDDPSGDDMREQVEALGHPWLRLVQRTGKRGLSEAVLEGLRSTRAHRLVIMDADLSHPASAVPAMIKALDDGAEFVLGSRYVPGGTTSEEWGMLRWMNSKGAVLLARPLTSLRDPMSGFFAFDRSLLERADDLSPVGYKIGLEILVKSRARRVVEVPIHFAQRSAGKSKLTFRQQLLYIEHLRRLYLHRVRSTGKRQLTSTQRSTQG